ncbi:rolling circle replication-associated protein [Photobacterium swingsii]|uniref:rolling circle replication-associated protein n=1 Tax=Photobacterium swingsii TaxID=680026 RepID=UPI004068EFE1
MADANSGDDLISDKDLRYVAAAVQPQDVTQNHQASYDAGFLGFDFCGARPQPITPQQMWELNRVNRDTDFIAQQQRDHVTNTPTFNAESLRAAAARSDEDNRLVQGRKSPTRLKQSRIAHRVGVLNKARRGNTTLDSAEAFYNHDTLYASTEANEGKALSTVRLMNREWSGQFRVLHHTQTRPSDAPEQQSGDRYTENLTKRAVTKIFESGAYVAACHGGFTTFLTLTFTPEQRNAIFSKETTLGKEVSRFLDGAKKMYQRGWQDIGRDEQPFELDGIEKPFHYMWVAECPANDDGEPNPHVHLLMNWNVERNYFDAWADRIESLWGNGFAHLEHITQPKAAGTYLIKAVGYAAKGENADQGLIRGNRYNIARCSRAPAWECVASFEASNMAAIIKELGYKLEQWRKPLTRRLKRIEKQKDQAIAAKAIAKKAKKPKEHLKKLSALIAKLEHQAKAARDQIKSRGVHATTNNLFCVAFDGEQAEEKAYDFLLWAAGARGWSMVATDADDDYHKAVDVARDAAQSEYADHFYRFKEKRAYWQSVLHDPLTPPMYSEDEIKATESYSMMLVEQYQQLAA